MAGARFPAGPVHATGLHGYCEYNVCTGTRCRPSGRVRSNCDLTGRLSCTNYPCPPERPFSELVDFIDPESGRMLVESGPYGLRALVERIRAGRPYPQINVALATLGEMADRRWMWRDHTEADDWERLRGVASTYLNRSPLSLDDQVIAHATETQELDDADGGRTTVSSSTTSVPDDPSSHNVQHPDLITRDAVKHAVPHDRLGNRPS